MTLSQHSFNFCIELHPVLSYFIVLFLLAGIAGLYIYKTRVKLPHWATLMHHWTRRDFPLELLLKSTSMVECVSFIPAALNVFGCQKNP